MTISSVADRDRDHLRREPEPGKRRPIDAWAGGTRSTHPPSFLSMPTAHRPGSTDATARPAAHQEHVPTPGTDTQNVFLCRV
jgi:hypothetical protein